MQILLANCVIIIENLGIKLYCCVACLHGLKLFPNTCATFSSNSMAAKIAELIICTCKGKIEPRQCAKTNRFLPLEIIVDFGVWHPGSAVSKPSC
jgi:hypothetical protein